MRTILSDGKKSILFYERLYRDVVRVITFQHVFGQNYWEKKKNYYERYDKRIFSDLNSNLQVSSCDDSIKSLHAYSRCHVVIKAWSYFMFENDKNIMRTKISNLISQSIIPIFMRTIHVHEVIAKISQQHELTNFLTFQLLDWTNSSSIR